MNVPLEREAQVYFMSQIINLDESTVVFWYEVYSKKTPLYHSIIFLTGNSDNHHNLWSFRLVYRFSELTFFGLVQIYFGPVEGEGTRR